MDLPKSHSTQAIPHVSDCRERQGLWLHALPACEGKNCICHCFTFHPIFSFDPDRGGHMSTDIYYKLAHVPATVLMAIYSQYYSLNLSTPS